MKKSVLAVILILAGCRHSGISPENECRSLLDQLNFRIMLFENAYGRLPTSEEGISYVLKKPHDWPPEREWKEFIEPERPELLTDPWGRKYGYLLYPDSPFRFVVYSVGPKRLYHSLETYGVAESAIVKLLPESEQRLFERAE